MRDGVRPTILLVDDKPQIRSFIRPALEDAGFNCVEAVDGEEALYLFEEARPDLIVLDIELVDPDLDGLEVCKRIRARGSDVPVIFLTVRSTLEDMERCLIDSGPNTAYQKKLKELLQIQMEEENVDFALKRPDTRELILNIRAKLNQRAVRELGPDLRITWRERKVERRIAGRWEEARLPPLGYELLKTLVEAEGGVVGMWELFDRVFQCGSQDAEEAEEYVVENYKNRVWVCISKVRKAIDPLGQHDYIQTVQRFGYKFVSPALIRLRR